MSDALPEPIEAGRQYAQAKEESHQLKDDLVYQLKELEHSATPEERAAHREATLEIIRTPPVGIPLIKSPVSRAETKGLPTKTQSKSVYMPVN